MPRIDIRNPTSSCRLCRNSGISLGRAVETAQTVPLQGRLAESEFDVEGRI